MRIIITIMLLLASSNLWSQQYNITMPTPKEKKEALIKDLIALRKVLKGKIEAAGLSSDAAGIQAVLKKSDSLTLKRVNELIRIHRQELANMKHPNGLFNEGAKDNFATAISDWLDQFSTTMDNLKKDKTVSLIDVATLESRLTTVMANTNFPVSIAILDKIKTELDKLKNTAETREVIADAIQAGLDAFDKATWIDPLSDLYKDAKENYSYLTKKEFDTKMMSTGVFAGIIEKAAAVAKAAADAAKAAADAAKAVADAAKAAAKAAYETRLKDWRTEQLEDLKFANLDSDTSFITPSALDLDDKKWLRYDAKFKSELENMILAIKSKAEKRTTANSIKITTTGEFAQQEIKEFYTENINKEANYKDLTLNEIQIITFPKGIAAWIKEADYHTTSVRKIKTKIELFKKLYYEWIALEMYVFHNASNNSNPKIDLDKLDYSSFPKTNLPNIEIIKGEFKKLLKGKEKVKNVYIKTIDLINPALDKIILGDISWVNELTKEKISQLHFPTGLKLWIDSCPKVHE